MATMASTTMLHQVRPAASSSTARRASSVRSVRGASSVVVGRASPTSSVVGIAALPRQQFRGAAHGVALNAAAVSRPAARAAALRVSAMADKEAEVVDPDAARNQLLGIKGASMETNIWKIRLQLTKPVTWVPLIWGVLCGAAASGHFTWTPENVAKSLLCMTMSGPLLTGRGCRCAATHTTHTRAQIQSNPTQSHLPPKKNPSPEP